MKKCIHASSRLVLILGATTIISSFIASGQSYSSGSTGADGALFMTGGVSQTVQVPPSGILNYTTINIQSGNLFFQRNLTNTPVILLAQGAVTIGGAVRIDGSGQVPGPGGFYGGSAGLPGLGPGGGTMSGSANGTWAGPLTLVPIIGGSGGAGINAGYGGGGGGAIVIASSASITISTPGSINAAAGSYASTGGAGAIRLVANSINVAGSLAASIVRFEAPTGQVTYNGTTYGAVPVVAPINPLITPTHPPSLIITSIAGYPVPSYATGSLTTADLLLPNQLPDPLPVIVQGINVPVGSPVTVNFSGSPSATSTTASLVGTSSSSTATVYISNLTRNTLTYLLASATFDPSLISQNLKPIGPNGVSKIELAAAPGAPTTYRFLRADGSQLKLENLSIELRRALGL